MAPGEYDRDMKAWVLAGCLLLFGLNLIAQDVDTGGEVVDAYSTHAGHVPLLSGGMGYIYNVNGGIPTLEPQINPVLLLPLGSHLLVENRTSFTGFFERRNGTSGDYTGRVFTTIDYAQLDWLANTHVMVVAGRYILPFGIYQERLQPIWIANLQDTPIDLPIGTQTSGSGNGGELRGVIKQTDSFSVQYTAYFSAYSNVHELEAARTAGGDGSIYFTKRRLELGGSYQRFLQGRHINSVAGYVSWQPLTIPLDLKGEYDRSYNGNGYWAQGAYMLSQVPAANSFFKNLQLVGRMQQFYPLNGGGDGLPRVNTQQVDFGINYYLWDNNFRLISSYGRQFNSNQDYNIWFTGFTYRFLWPLWPGRK